MKWNELDTKAQVKALILAAFVLFVLLALLWPSNRPGARARPAARPPAQGPQMPVRTPAQPDRPRQVALPPAKDAGMLGRWQSGGLQLPRRGTCNLWMDVSRNTQDATLYIGAATLNCAPIIATGNPRRDALLRRFGPKPVPIAATLSGTWEKDAIALRVEKLFNGGECGLKGFTISRFGTQYVAVELRDECGGGSAVMHKAA